MLSIDHKGLLCHSLRHVHRFLGGFVQGGTLNTLEPRPFPGLLGGEATALSPIRTEILGEALIYLEPCLQGAHEQGRGEWFGRLISNRLKVPS